MHTGPTDSDVRRLQVGTLLVRSALTAAVDPDDDEVLEPLRLVQSVDRLVRRPVSGWTGGKHLVPIMEIDHRERRIATIESSGQVHANLALRVRPLRHAEPKAVDAAARPDRSSHQPSLGTQAGDAERR